MVENVGCGRGGVGLAVGGLVGAGVIGKGMGASVDGVSVGNASSGLEKYGGIPRLSALALLGTIRDIFLLRVLDLFIVFASSDL